MFLKFLIWSFLYLKWYLPTAVSFITASHTLTKRVFHSIFMFLATFFFQNCVYFPLFLQELSFVRHFSRTPVWLVYKSITPVNIQLSRRKINEYSGTVCHYTNLSLMKMRSEKINIYFDTVYHTTSHYTAQLLLSIWKHNIRFLLSELKR